VKAPQRRATQRNNHRIAAAIQRPRVTPQRGGQRSTIPKRQIHNELAALTAAALFISTRPTPLSVIN